MERPDPVHLPHRLRLRGERRGEETAGQDLEESPAVQCRIILQLAAWLLAPIPARLPGTSADPSREPANASFHGWSSEPLLDQGHRSRRLTQRQKPAVAHPAGRAPGRERVEARSDRHAGVANVPPKRLDLRVRLRQFARDNGVIREPASGAQRARGLYRHPTASASLRCGRPPEYVVARLFGRFSCVHGILLVAPPPRGSRSPPSRCSSPRGSPARPAPQHLTGGAPRGRSCVPCRRAPPATVAMNACRFVAGLPLAAV